MPDINIKADDKHLQGKYANLCVVTSQERDVVLDFVSVVGMNGKNEGQLVSRIFLNRFTAQDLIATLQKTMEQWEKMRYEQNGQGNQTPQV